MTDLEVEYFFIIRVPFSRVSQWTDSVIGAHELSSGIIYASERLFYYENTENSTIHEDCLV